MLNTATTFPQTYQAQYRFHFDVTQRLLELARALPDEVYQIAARISAAFGTKARGNSWIEVRQEV